MKVSFFYAKYKIGDVVYLNQGEFEDTIDYIVKSDAFLIITGLEKGGKKFNYYVCDVYICSRRRWEEGQLFLSTAYDDDFLPLSDPTFFKEVIALSNCFVL